MQKKYGIGVALLGIVLIAVGTFNFGLTKIVGSTVPGVVDYEGIVCVDVKRADGAVESLGCRKNAIENTGLDLIRDTLSGNATNGWRYPRNITVGNASHNPISTNGFSGRNGTYQKRNGYGNWTLSYTFTATAPTTVDRTRLYATYAGATGGGTHFASNTFTSTTLQANDQLTITWNLKVS